MKSREEYIPVVSVRKFILSKVNSKTSKIVFPTLQINFKRLTVELKSILLPLTFSYTHYQDILQYKQFWYWENVATLPVP